MARIKTYVNDNNISEYDTVIGSDAESLSGTKNYSLGSLREFIVSGLNIIGGPQVNSDWNSNSGVSRILNKPSIDGSETKINNGTNVTITGTGTVANPYIINSSGSSVDGSETKINPTGTNITVTGTGTTVNPYIINSSASSNNLQRVVSSAFTLSNSDNNYTIILNNGSSDFSITVPTGLDSNFNVGFIQQGTGVISFLAQGTTINTPSGLKIKGSNYNAYLEKVGSTQVYQLFGNLIV